MAHETSVRLPGRLIGIVRTDAAAAAPVGPQVVAAATPPAHSAVAPKEPSAEREHLRQVVASLAQAAATLRTEHRDLMRAVEPLAIELAMAVAFRFLGGKAADGQFALAALIQEAMGRLDDTGQSISVQVHPDDLRSLSEELQEKVVRPGLRFIGDPALQRGSCRVQCQDRSLRFDWQSRLAALRQQLLESVTERSQ